MELASQVECTQTGVEGIVYAPNEYGEISVTVIDIG